MLDTVLESKSDLGVPRWCGYLDTTTKDCRPICGSVVVIIFVAFLIVEAEKNAKVYSGPGNRFEHPTADHQYIISLRSIHF